MVDQAIALFMNRRVLSGEAETPLCEVVRRMHGEGQSAFIVCDDGRPVGVITERDAVAVLAAVFSGTDYRTACAADVMASPTYTLPESAAMVDVVRLMRERGFRRVPIVDDKQRLSGIVNLTELQNATNAELERRGRDLEAAVLARTAELRDANAQLERLSRQDSLTGLSNRRAMTERIESLHAAHRRYGHRYAVVLMDVDHFKLYNDSQGHLAGDFVLRQVGAMLGNAIRASDTAFRYGGEEFVVLLPETDAEGARSVAERIRAVLASLALPHPASPSSPVVTLSMGITDVSTRDSAEESGWESVVARADAGLYRSKEAGRDRFTIVRDGD